MEKCTIPSVIPSGWKTLDMPIGSVIVHITPSGMRCMFGLEKHGDTYVRHLSLSRPDKYPDWDEMKLMIYESGLFDPNKAVVMTLPPKNKPAEYVNLHPHTFHWNQET